MLDGYVGASSTIYRSDLEEVNPRAHPMERELLELKSRNRNSKIILKTRFHKNIYVIYPSTKINQ